MHVYQCNIFFNYTKPIQHSYFFPPPFLPFSIVHHLTVCYTTIFQNKICFPFLIKKGKDLIWWAGLKEQVSGTGQYEDPLLPFPPEDENNVFEMLLYKELKMPDTFQNISQTYWILN